MSEKETEVKFYLSNPARLFASLERAGAVLVQPRVFEVNLRYDTPKLELSAGARVLRLRQDTEAHLTYKGPGQIIDGVLTRQEIEFTLSDFTAARHFLEALGYEVILTYEKYRQTYAMDDLLISIDEMPYGTFSEIEGLRAAQIQETAARFGLNWSARINRSYADIFRQLKADLALPFSDLTFENFSDLVISPQDMNIVPAD
jgi:adenylate cyclase class 2